MLEGPSQIVGQTTEALRGAGYRSAHPPGEPASSQAVFARRAAYAAAAAAPAAATSTGDEQWDEVDALFRAG